MLLTTLSLSLSTSLLLLPSSSAAAADGSSPGQVFTFTLPGCDPALQLGKKHEWTMPPDSCLSVTTSSTFHILEPAVCANGTRAKLARFEGRGCNKGRVTAEDGLVEILDDELAGDRCFSIFPDSLNGEAEKTYASFSLYCDGRKASDDDGDDDGDDEEKPQGPRKGSVSPNACRRRGGSPRAPTFRHPYADVCQNLPAGQPLKVIKPALCDNGTQSLLAGWRGRNCRGEPLALTELDEDNIDRCLDVAAEEDEDEEDEEEQTSWAFWCEGDVERDEDERRGGGGGGGSVWGLVLILLLIGLFGLLALGMALHRWAKIFEAVMGLFRPREGAIAL